MESYFGAYCAKAVGLLGPLALNGRVAVTADGLTFTSDAPDLTELVVLGAMPADKLFVKSTSGKVDVRRDAAAAKSEVICSRLNE